MLKKEKETDPFEELDILIVPEISDEEFLDRQPDPNEKIVDGDPPLITQRPNLRIVK